jgi:WD40 repeat protein
MLVLEGSTAGVASLSFSNDGEFLAAGARDGTLRMWHGLELVADVLKGDTKLSTVNAIAFRPDCQHVIFGGRDDTLLGWDPVLRELFNVLPNRSSPIPIDSLAFLSPTLLAFSTGQLELFDSAEARSRPTPRMRCGPLAVHATSGFIARSTSQAPDQLGVWNIAKPDQFTLPQRHAIRQLAFHPDGTQIAAAVEYTVVLFDVLARREGHTIKAHTGRVSSLAYSPDGRTLATASWDQTIKLWDAQTLALRATFDWKIGRYSCVRYSPDGLRLAAAGDSGAIIIWDTE